MKQKIITGIFILITFLLLFVVIFESKKNITQKKDNTTIDKPIILVSPSLNLDIFYWGKTCPHCHDTIDWMDKYKIDEKIVVVRKEVYENDNNAKELAQNAKICGIAEKEIKIPFMFTKNQKCITGTPDITSYLKEQINTLEINNKVID